MAANKSARRSGPKSKYGGATKRKSIAFPVKLLDAIEANAIERGISTSECIIRKCGGKVSADWVEPAS